VIEYMKLEVVTGSIRESFPLWRDLIVRAWVDGNRAGYGFAIGDIYDKLSTALVKDGYSYIIEDDDIAVGTNNINSIIAVANIYGPWAVDVTDSLMQSLTKEVIRIPEYQKI
jgi:hypothetical protein